MSGNEAVATAMKQINPDVMGAFPITPSTEIPQYFSQYIADGEVDTEFVAVESEHSAMSVCIGASAAGARAVTATSSAGLAYMWELLYVAASARLPITMAVVNRALTGPININNDHSDSMGARDSGWIQIYAESNQEVYDNYIQAMPISETHQTSDHDLSGRIHHQPRCVKHRAARRRRSQGVRGRIQPRELPAQVGKPAGSRPLRHLAVLHGGQEIPGAGHERRDADNHGRCEEIQEAYRQRIRIL